MTMRTLSEIIDAVRDNEEVECDEMFYAICALDALSTFDDRAMQRLCSAEIDKGIPKTLNSAQFQYEEMFRRWKTALSKSPKDWVGWYNDPRNPEFTQRRKTAKKLVNKAFGAEGKQQ